jgi:hypothetical protein
MKAGRKERTLGIGAIRPRDRRASEISSFSLLVLNLAIGTSLVLAVAGAALRRARSGSDRRRRLARALVAVPLPLAVTVHLLVELPLVLDEVMFATGALAFAAGAFLMLGRDDDLGTGRDDSEPPWWPEFERRLQEYSKRPSPRPDGVVVP